MAQNVILGCKRFRTEENISFIWGRGQNKLLIKLTLTSLLVEIHGLLGK